MPASTKKTTRKRVATTASEVEVAHSELDEVALASAEVEKMQEDGKYNLQLVSHLSWTKLNAARIENERAKIAERAEKRLRAIAWPQAVSWCKRLSDAEWSRFAREVETARDGKGSVLG